MIALIIAGWLVCGLFGFILTAKSMKSNNYELGNGEIIVLLFLVFCGVSYLIASLLLLACSNDFNDWRFTKFINRMLK